MAAQRVVMWFRRDFRLADNPALAAAAADGREVVPLFVVDPAFERAGAARRAYMAAALNTLDTSMDRALVYRHGDPLDVVAAFAEEVGASTVYVAKDFGPYGRRRDAEVSARLRAAGRSLVGVGSPYAVEPGTVRKGDGSPYAVFTPFSKAWRAIGWAAPIEAPDVAWVGAPAVPCDGPPDSPSLSFELPPIGEQAAVDRWQQFAGANLAAYDDRRNLPGLDATSRLSADLRWGVVHPRQLLQHLDDSRDHTVFGSELAWRDFYADVLHHRPATAWENLNPKMNAMSVDTDDRARSRFSSWCAGTTGYPIVDAGMRQLLATGWMHNRVRMIVASFLVKDLHLPWQWGAQWFMQHLIDGDIASNNHGWQWTAGTGTDAAPYFRIFNPTAQSERYDPDGTYIRQWVPELTDLPKSVIYDPGLLRPSSYPPPMVDHARERDEALARYKVVSAARQ
jgi:deoxyribodipyrimidine photo-lyase